MESKNIARAAIALSLVFLLGVLMGGLIALNSQTAAVPVPPSQALLAATERIVIHNTDAFERDLPPKPKRNRITAYCACKECCGHWANNRPSGKVLGAYGDELQAGVSVAANLPNGTRIEIDGLGSYIVQDKLADWVLDKYGDTVDIYFDKHEDAVRFGLQWREVKVKGDGLK